MTRGMNGRGFHYAYDRVPPPKNFKDVFRYLKQLLGGFFMRFAYIVRLVWKSGKWIILLLMFIALFKGVTPVISSLISKSILNELQSIITQGGLPEAEFWSSNILYLLIFLFTYKISLTIINNINNALKKIAGEKVVNQVKRQIMEKSKELDLASFDSPTFYEKMENANREAGNRPLTLLSETFSIISTVIEFVSYLLILLTAPDLAWVTFVIVLISIPSAIINFIYRRKHFRYMRHRSKERREMSYFSDIIVNKDMIKEIRMYDLADTFIKRYMKSFLNYYQGLRRLILSESVWHVVIGIISSLTNLIFYILIAKKVFVGQLMVGDYTLYTGAITSVAACVSTLITNSATIYEGTLFIDNLISFMEEKQTVISTKKIPDLVQRNEGHTIEFCNVSFRYPGTERNVLQNINLKIRPGETVVLVGLNGAGKTTLLKLLTRLYDPTEGVILLDGKDIREYDIQNLYQIFGIIFQDFGKYAVSVEENIRFGNIHKDGDLNAVMYAAEKSAASEYIESLPNKYQTPLMRVFEPDGIELSGGQWQKLAIARAFYADSDIMILDEPTAALDPMAEQEIYNRFDELRADKMTIFVSHRLSSATIADQIFVLEHGRLIECGSHQELMDLHGKYHELFSTQAKWYRSQKERNDDERPPFDRPHRFRPPRHQRHSEETEYGFEE